MRSDPAAQGDNWEGWLSLANGPTLSKSLALYFLFSELHLHARFGSCADDSLTSPAAASEHKFTLDPDC